ncbi:MAG: hypothetical protein ABJA98_04725 [Acidobacteriota bacterium]
MRIDILAPAGGRFPRRNEPIRLGVPLGRGTLHDAGRLSLSGPGGRPRPVAGRALDRWSDGSIRWLLLDLHVDHDGLDHQQACELHLDIQTSAPIAPALSVSDAEGTITIDTGAARFRLRAGGSFPFDAVLAQGASTLDVAATGLTIDDARHGPCTVAISDLVVEETNELRAVVRADGWASSPRGDQLIRIVTRMHFFTGSPTVRFEVTLRNPQRAVHAGGRWELGDAGSILIRDATMTFAQPPSTLPEIQCSPEIGIAVGTSSGDVELYQDSSGGEHWNASTHVNRDGAVPLTFRGYRLRTGSLRTQGLRATPIVTLADGSRHLSVAMPQFWQNFPKALEASGRTLSLRLFPRHCEGGHELQGGEQKTHTFFVAFARDRISEPALAWARQPLLARATPADYCASGALSYLMPVAAHAGDAHRRLVDAAIDGDDTIDAKRERIDEYGWRHFGDWYADHEAVFHSGPRPLISHYNNQYDAIAGCTYQFMRSGDPRWWTHLSDLAAHVADIDVYHTDADKAAYNHGLFWHTLHYVDAGRATHRAYPRVEGVGGGGPSNEHNYARGMMLHYFLTGDAISRDTAVGLAEWVIAMDDGRATIFRWLARGATGLASSTFSPTYHGPGRGAAYSIDALLVGYQLTGNGRFVEEADTLIRRCIHPADDIQARGLLDRERRWSYTVFLSMLGRYLDFKIECGSLDAMYAYARSSLLAYARWMAIHEYPYLDRPEELEYPTETWAAQELWKSDVFGFAARHADEAERAVFLERSGFFFDRSVDTLSRLATRTLTRPVALLLGRGFLYPYLQHHAETPTPAPNGSFTDIGYPGTFVPQKVRAKQRLIGLAIVTAVLVAATVALLNG